MDSVPNAAPGCVRHGCRFSAAADLLAQAETGLRQMTRSSMSAALWCDQGGHAFSERDPGRQRIMVNTLDAQTEQEVSVSKDFCGQCAEQAGLTSPRRTRPAIGNGQAVAADAVP